MVSPLSHWSRVHRWPLRSPVCAGLAMELVPRSAASARAQDYAHDGEPHGEASVSRPNNALGHANRGTPYQNADAPQSCSCRTLKLLTVWWSAPTRTQQSPRRACGRSALNQIQALLRLESSRFARPTCVHLKAKFRNRWIAVMSDFTGQYVFPISC